MTSLYQSTFGKQEILNLYETKLNSLGIDYEYKLVNTKFGFTNIILTGNPENPPIILVHGSNACAPISLETYPQLHKHFAVYAVDILAQPNKSAETRLNMKDDSYGVWMNEVIDQLNLQSVSMAGFSFGGLVILKTLEYKETKIKEVFLSAPAYIVNGSPFRLLSKVFLPMMLYKKFNADAQAEKLINRLFTDADPFALTFLKKVIQYFSMDFSPVPIIPRKKANKITTPIHIFASQQDLLFPGNKMIKRARKIFPSLKHIQLFPNAKHVQNHHQNSIVEEYIIKSEN